MLKDLPIAALKYIPHQQESDSWALARHPDKSLRLDASGLPIPPDELLVGYADSAEVYLQSGRRHAEVMLDMVKDSGLTLPSSGRILDFGCGIGRMTRNLKDQAISGEVWGVDISAPHIHWCKMHLSPPFKFATTTTIPHLPFPDHYFDFVYAASVFTHVEDLADAWLLEVRRIVAPTGRVYLTLHDDSTIEMLNGPCADHWLSHQLRDNPVFQASGGVFGMLVIGRDTNCQVFYSREYFQRTIDGIFNLLTISPCVHGYQTAYVLSPK